MDTETSLALPTTAHIAPASYHVVSPADRFVEAMDEATGFDRAFLATCAIRHDPGCIEARLVLAEHSQDLSTRLRHLEAAVAAGEWLWNPVSERAGSDLSWWYDVGTRPYMQALQGLGMALLESGYPEESRACFERLLTMNPNDSQGIRHLAQDPSAGPRF